MSSNNNYQEVKEQKRKQKRSRSCLYFFKLETAMILLTFLDTLTFITYFRMSSTDYERNIATNMGYDIDKVQSTKSIQSPTDMFLQEEGLQSLYSQTQDLKHKRRQFGDMNFFYLTTDFFLLFVFAAKLYYGLRLSKLLLFPGTPTEEFLMEEKGDERFKIRVMTQQRDYLYNYYMYSVFFQRFAIIQCICLSYVVYIQWHLMLKLCIVSFYSLFQYEYAHNKMDTLVKTMNKGIQQYHLKKYNKKAAVESKKKQKEEELQMAMELAKVPRRSMNHKRSSLNYQISESVVDIDQKDADKEELEGDDIQKTQTSEPYNSRINASFNNLNNESVDFQ